MKIKPRESSKNSNKTAAFNANYKTAKKLVPGKTGSKMQSPNLAADLQKNGKCSPQAQLTRRSDWMDFREPSRISNKAGVPFRLLPKVVVKELDDDARDASEDVQFGLVEVTEDFITFFVADAGPGLNGTNEDIAELYSIRRDLLSSKMVRLPSRGMLGNGLRVVAGVVLISGGQLRVSTRGRTLTLRPRAEDGRTEIVSVEPWDGVGTRVEVTLRGVLAHHAQSEEDGGLFVWAEESRWLAQGTRYKGKSSPHWYDPAGFWELCQAFGNTRVGTFVERYLDGCSAKVAKVASEFAEQPCSALTLDQATDLLDRARLETNPVIPERLGKVGRRDDFFGYGHEKGFTLSHGAKVPFVVEVWANRADEPSGLICVNRTPVCANVSVERRDGSDYAIFGCQLRCRFSAGRKDSGDFRILINIITPSIPLTSSGKDPDLDAMWPEIKCAIERAIKGVKRNAPKVNGKKFSQKNFIRSRIKAAAEKLSGGGKYLFSLRQLFYELRPGLIAALGREPKYGTFSRIVGEYEDENGDVENLYRDDRGTLYHPHTKETIQLGTRSVAKYERPPYTFKSLLFCEKEGLFPMLKHADWPELFDCALCSCKGFATRAVRALLRIIKYSPELTVIFVIHDADGPGTVIYEALQKKLEPYGVEVINLGLDPAEARAMGLAPEPVIRKKKKRVPVAEYIPDNDREWLQNNRIELNGMTTPQFIEWLSDKVGGFFQEEDLPLKVMPPAKVVGERMERETREAIRNRITQDVLAAANIPAQVEAELAKAKRQVKSASKELAKGLTDLFTQAPKAHWTDFVKEQASAIAGMPRTKAN